MKQIIKFLAIAVVMFSFAGTVQAQTATATSNAAAVIIAPLSITNTTGLHFGTIMRSATSGTVSIATNGNRSSLGGVTLSSLAPLHSAATFNVEGESGRTVTITLPASTTITNAASDNMVVDNFVSDPDDANPVTLTGAATVLRIGATLNVGANQPSGTYTGTFSVSVNYN
jgi:hypothetical protein